MKIISDLSESLRGYEVIWMMLFRVLVASGVAVEQLESLRVGHGIGILETLMIGVELCVGVQKVKTQSRNESTGEDSTNRVHIICLFLISHF